MGTVIEFPSQASQIAAMAGQLSADGQLCAEGLRDVAAWRRQARAAARTLGRPVQTLAHGDTGWAVLKDWPRDAEEQAIRDEKVQQTIAAMSLNPGT